MATTALLQSGDVIGGFRIDDVIGIGGMAIVYRAEQISLGRPVALKVLTSKLSRDEVFRERFRREGTHAAGLEHPNIVPVYDSGEQDGNLYIAMRLVEGTNLAELIQTRGLTADQTIELLRPIASALDTAHAAGLIHRDVKPQNILITAHGHPYLADFGVAKGSNTEGLTATGGFVGSVNYASPEQIKGLTLTPASDVYALTAVLYQCLTAHVPFARETDAGVMHAHLHDPPPTLPASSGADSDFHSVLARGMAKDPGSRYGHAGDLINAAALCVGRLPAASRKTVPAFPAPAEGADSADAGAERSGAGDGAITGADEFAAVRAAASFTEADRRRPAAPESPAQKPPTRRPKAILAGGVAVLIVLVLVVVLATAGAGSSRASTFRGGDLILSARSGWQRAHVSVDGLTLSEAVSISSGAIGVDAGTIATTPTIPASLPRALVAKYGKPAQTSVITLPLGQARSYTWPSGSHGALSLLVIATARGEQAIACTTSLAAQLPALMRACTAIRATARIIGAPAEYPGPDPMVTRSLARALASRSKALAAVFSGVRASRLSARAAALDALAASDEEAGHAIASVSAPPRDRAAIAALTSGLAREVALIRQLSTAAREGEADRYESVRGRLASEHVAAAGAALAGAGFTGLALPALQVPRAPSRVTAHRASAPAPASTRSAVEPAVAAPSPQPTYTPPAASAPSSHGESEETVISKPQ